MPTAKYVSWREDDAWLGYLEDYPDYWTQGETLDDLIAHLDDLALDLKSGAIPVGSAIADHPKASAPAEGGPQ